MAAIDVPNYQLRLTEKACCFDLSLSLDTFAIACPKILKLFHFTSVGDLRGVPYRSIPYEGKSMSKIAFQRDGLNVGALRSGRISILNPKNALRPYVGLVEASSQIVDFDWSYASPHVICGLNKDCSVRLWDLRSPPSPALLLSVPFTDEGMNLNNDL